MKVLIGYTYAVTAKTDTTVTDTDGLSLSVKAGSQGYFVATVDTITVTGNATIAQIRGNFNVPTTSGGGGGLTLAPGDMVFCDMDGTVETWFNAANATNGNYVFKGNQNLAGVDWNVNMPKLTSATEMFAGSQLKSFNASMPKLKYIPSIFQGCTNLSNARVTMLGAHPRTDPNDITNAFAGCINLTDATLAITNGVPYLNVNLTQVFDGCSELTDVDIYFAVINVSNVTIDFTNAFNGCTQLETIYVHTVQRGQLSGTITADGMFLGCMLGPEQLQQILDWNWWPKNTTAITIGVDSTKVTQSDIDNNWNDKFVAKHWNVTWQLNPAGTMYVSNGPTELPPSKG